MREPINTSTYENIWDSASHRQQRQRFDAPKSYAPPPASTHEWYREVMKNKPDPKALKAVFPWEEKEEEERKKTTEGRSFVEAANVAKASAAAALAASSPTESRSPTLPQSPDQQPGAIPIFTNAWDAIPGIGRYANRLAVQTGAVPRRRQSSQEDEGSAGASSGSVSDGLGSRKSSLKEPTSVAVGGKAVVGGSRSDASSRDGDDEDDDNDEANSSDEGQSERYKITFKVKDGKGYSASGHPHQHHHGHHRSGSSSPTNGSSGGSSPVISSKAPTTARRTSSTGSTSPRIPSKPVSELSPSASSISSGTVKSPRITTAGGSVPPPVGQTSPLLATSPRLAAQALRNSTAARISSSGSVGDGPPLVRATRVFSPETDTGVVKQQGLAALERFVQNMNSGTAPISPSGPPGTAGAFRQ